MRKHPKISHNRQTVEHKCLSPRKGAVLGGLVVFIWQAFSWTALPFHNKTVQRFANPAPLLNALAADTEQSGVYILANDPKSQTAPSDPFIFLSYHKKGWGSMGQTMALGLLIQMVGAFFWTWILGKIPGLTSKDAALYGLFFGICVGVLGSMSNWAWWKFPAGFSLLYVLDDAVSWAIASVVIAKRCQASACALPAKNV